MNDESSLPALPNSQTGADASHLAWETIFEAIEDGICVQSLDSRIVRANSDFAAIIGASLEQIVGQTCLEVFGCANETGAIQQFCARSVSGETGYICNFSGNWRAAMANGVIIGGGFGGVMAAEALAQLPSNARIAAKATF